MRRKFFLVLLVVLAISLVIVPGISQARRSGYCSCYVTWSAHYPVFWAGYYQPYYHYPYYGWNGYWAWRDWHYRGHWGYGYHHHGYSGHYGYHSHFGHGGGHRR